jgi:MFS family permease
VSATRPARPSVPLLLALSSLGAVLAPLNSTMVAIALPDIRHEFSLSHGAVAWLVSGYLIAMAVAQPLGGRLGDQLGRERVYRAGLWAFLALSIGTTLAPTFLVLVVLRIAQAVAGAVLIPNGMAMLRTQAPPDQLGRLNGMNGAVISVAAAGGPLIGAAALAIGSWRLLFPLSIPVVLVALFLLQRLPAVEEERPRRTPIDWFGMALFIALLVVVTLQLGALRSGAGGGVMAARWAAAGAVAAAFAWRQRSTSSPAAEWRLFRVRSFAGATAYVLFANLSMYTTLLMIPFFIRDVQGKGSFTSGLLLGAMSVLVAFTAPIGGRISDAYGRRLPAQAGAVLMTAGAVALLAGLHTDVSIGYLAACLALLGVGLGMGTGAATTAAVESAPRALAGSASGTSSMMRYVGSILGAGVLAGVLKDSAAGHADIDTFRFVMMAVVATAGLAAVAATFIHRLPAPLTTAVPAEPPGHAPALGEMRPAAGE